MLSGVRQVREGNDRVPSEDRKVKLRRADR